MNAMTEIPPAKSERGTGDLPVYDARDLVGGEVQACITLDGQVYYLRITRSRKLILTK